MKKFVVIEEGFTVDVVAEVETLEKAMAIVAREKIANDGNSGYIIRDNATGKTMNF